MPLAFAQPILHGANRLYTAPPPPCHCPPRPPGISTGTLNIKDDRGFGLAQVIRVVERGFFDFMLLTETKIQTKVCYHNQLGYNVTCYVARPYSSGVAQAVVCVVTRK